MGKGDQAKCPYLCMVTPHPVTHEKRFTVNKTRNWTQAYAEKVEEELDAKKNHVLTRKVKVVMEKVKYHANEHLVECQEESESP